MSNGIGERVPGFDYSSGSVRARAAAAETNLPRLRAELEELDKKRRDLMRGINEWEQYQRQAEIVEAQRERMTVHGNGELSHDYVLGFLWVCS